MRKLLAITWREIYTRFTDRALLIITILAPLGISTIVGLAFGGLGAEGSPVEHIPVIVVDQDEGAAERTSFGRTLSHLLIEGELDPEAEKALGDCPTEGGAGARMDSSLDVLIDGQIFDQARASELVSRGEVDAPGGVLGASEYVLAVAKAAVDRGRYTALVHIPTDFSQSLIDLTRPGSQADAVEVRIYANRGRGISAAIVRGVVEGITNQMANGTIAIGVSIEELLSRQPSALAGLDEGAVDSAFACAFMPRGDLVTLDLRGVQTAAEESQAGGILVAVGSAQGMFFALFTAQFGILSLYVERRNWTLQRMIATPTPRWAILGGKLLGVIGSVLFQLITLALALTLVGSLMSGRLVLIWGDNFILLAALLLAVGTAVGGLGMMLAGILRSIEQANIVASVLNIALGVLGGAFGFLLPVQVAGISMIYWGREAFELLAAGQTEIGLHLAVLFGQGVILFGLGLLIFSRRFEVA